MKKRTSLYRKPRLPSAIRSRKGSPIGFAMMGQIQILKRTKARRKTSVPHDPEMESHYDFRDGVRGNYAERFAQGTNLVLLAPDVSNAFPSSEAVNEALRTLMGANQE